MAAAVSDVEGWLRAQEAKELLRFVTIGSVDDGKSTLIGRLLHDAHGLYEDQLNAIRRASSRGSTRGAGSSSEIDFSLFTDGLLAEREQGITIDVAYRYFATDKRKFIIADTPGHVQYTRNMATGASTAEVAIILVDARLGVLAQTRRHAHIAALLGIRHLVACVNKMDLVEFDAARFEAIESELAVVTKKLGGGEVTAIPVSALRGDNVVTRSAAMPWWTGPTLLELLESVPVAAGIDDGPLRLPVQLVLRPDLDYRGFAGRIASGVVRRGDEVLALPSGRRSRVAGVDVAGREVGEAHAPMNVVLRLEDEIDVSRGDMFVTPGAAPRSDTDFEADVVWMSERELDRGRSYLLKHTTRTVRAEVVEIIHRTDLDRLLQVAPASPVETVGLNDIARVRVRVRSPIFYDAYRSNRTTGAFVLVDSVTNDTVAAGMIVGAARPVRLVPGNADAAGNAEVDAEKSQVSEAERRALVGHAGAVVHVRGGSREAARSLAFTVERELFDRQWLASVVEGGSADLEAAAACARAGVVAIVGGAGAGELTARVDGVAIPASSAAIVSAVVAATSLG